MRIVVLRSISISPKFSFALIEFFVAFTEIEVLSRYGTLKYYLSSIAIWLIDNVSHLNFVHHN